MSYLVKEERWYNPRAFAVTRVSRTEKQGRPIVGRRKVRVPSDKEKLMMRSLTALYAQVPESIANDVRKNVLSAYNEIKSKVK